MKLLITGGAGFIGSNFIRFWLGNHPKDLIINLDKLTYAGHLSSLKGVSSNPRYLFVKGDICNSNLVNKIMADVDVVVHFAAESHVDRSISDPSTFVKTNVLGTQILLNSALNHKVKRFHHISTDEVFGALPLNTSVKFSETTPYRPHSPYSASKAASDHLVRAYHDTFGLPITITNCSNNFGPYQDPEKFLPRLIIKLIHKQKVPIYGDGLYVRDWLYVEDHCRAIEAVLLYGKVGDTYCVGGQAENLNNLQITRKLLSLFNLDDSFIEYVKDRPGHDRRYAVDWSKIKNELGWSPKHDFDAYLAKTVNWYQNNSAWWRPLVKRSEGFYAKRK